MHLYFAKRESAQDQLGAHDRVRRERPKEDPTIAYTVRIGWNDCSTATGSRGETGQKGVDKLTRENLIE